MGLYITITYWVPVKVTHKVTLYTSSIMIHVMNIVEDVTLGTH